MRSATSSSGGGRRRRGAALALAALVAGACGGEPRPSLLLVTLDTLRTDHVGAYGASPSPTPRLDALAAEGLVHEAAFTTMPTTGPAHVSLFTGLLPHAHGSDRNGVPMDPALAERELPARLREAGYATACFVTASVLAPRLTGFTGCEVYDGVRGALRPGRDAVAAALRWLDAERRRPVFLWVHLYDPHAPYGTPDDKRRGLPLAPGAYGWVDRARYADPAARRRMAERYAAGVREVDAALGALVAGVRERLPSDPLVAIVADHGEALDEYLDARGWAWDHGEFLDPAELRVPLVLWGPGVTPGRSPGPASIRDLYTTLLAAAGLPDPRAGAEGRRDLRVPDAAPRPVLAERRSFAGALEAPDAAARAAVRAHAVAASDGRRWLWLGEDGSAIGEATPELEAAAREVLARSAAGRGREAPPIDPATREALRALGYAP